MRLFALLIVALSQGVLPTAAYCSKPDAPYCAGRYDRFEDEYEFTSCRREMENYRSEVEDFTSCNNREAQEAVGKARRDNDEALDEYNDAVSSFNKRASQ